MFELSKKEWFLVAIVVLIAISWWISVSIRENAQSKNSNSPELVNRFFDGYAKSHPYESSVVSGNLEVVKRSYKLFPIPLPKRIVERYSFDQVKDDPKLDSDVLIIVNNGDRTTNLDVGKARIIHFRGEVKNKIISGGIISPPPDDRSDNM